MDPVNFDTVCYVAALLCFLAVALSLPPSTPGRIGRVLLGWLGAFFIVLAWATSWTIG